MANCYPFGNGERPRRIDDKFGTVGYHRECQPLDAMKKRLVVLIILFSAGCVPPSGTGSSAFRPAEGRTLIAVVAHPDDETIVWPVLAHYAREGARVYVVVA